MISCCSMHLSSSCIRLCRRLTYSTCIRHSSHGWDNHVKPALSQLGKSDSQKLVWPCNIHTQLPGNP